MRIKDNFVIQEVLDEHIAVPIASEADRLHGVIKLNETGAFIWKLLVESSHSEESLVEAIYKEYGMDMNTTKKDVDSFLEQLRLLGCLDS